MKKIFKKFRFSLIFVVTFFKKHQKLLLLGFLLGVLSFLVLPRLGGKVFSKNIERIGFVGKYTYDKLPLEIQQMISEGLTSISSDGHINPQLAESWEINKEGKEYIFTLKQNIFWHDGKLVKAQDINYNFSDVTTTALDGKRVKFELKEPFSPFLSVVAQPVFKKGLIGTGEYKVAKIKRNGEIVEKLLLIPKKDKSKQKIEIKFYPTEEAARMAFKLGEVDIIREITHPGELVSWQNIKITPEVKYNRFVAVFFNTGDPKLENKSIRQALAYAIQKKWPNRALTPINPHSWAYNPNVKPYNFDLENAKKLLEKSKENEQQLKEIELSTIPSLLEIAENIKKDWETLGILCKVKVVNTWEGSFQAILAIQEVPLDPDQYVFWHSTQQLNITKYKSPKIDKLLEEGRKTFNQEKRKEIYQDFQKSLIEDAPAAFLFHPTIYTLSRISRI
ncbi:MAG: ABC transporter substrate-binding protein [Microgenomates group bacterium]